MNSVSRVAVIALCIALFGWTNAHGQSAGDTLLRGLGLESYLEYPDLPDPAPLLLHKSPQQIVAMLGAPQRSSNLGSAQFAQYGGSVCLTRPQCGVTASCALTLTISENAVSDARIDGGVDGSERAQRRYEQRVQKICSSAIWAKLSGQPFTPIQ